MCAVCGVLAVASILCDLTQRCLTCCCGSWAAVVLFIGNFEELVSYFGFCATIFYALAAVVLIRLRIIHKDLHRPFVVRPYPLVPIVYGECAVCLACCVAL
jgi:amino acid transporter